MALLNLKISITKKNLIYHKKNVNEKTSMDLRITKKHQRLWNEKEAHREANPMHVLHKSWPFYAPHIQDLKNPSNKKKLKKKKRCWFKSAVMKIGALHTIKHGNTSKDSGIRNTQDGYHSSTDD